MTRMIALFSSVAAAAAAKARPRATPGAPSPPAPAPSPGVETTFNGLYPDGWVANFGTGALTQTTRSKPAKSSSIMADGYQDAPFDNTRVRRTTSISDVPAAGNVQMRHEYSRRQAYNCDNTKRLVQSTQSFWKVQDTATLAYLDMGGTSGNAPGHLVGFVGDCEPIWHPTDPNKIWHTGQNGAGGIWYEWDCVSKTNTTLFDMAPHMAALGGTFSNVNACWFNGEGRPSDDGRWWAFACENVVGSTFTSRGFCMYDRQTDSVVWSLSNPRGDRPNWVSTSPDGMHAILSWYSVAAATLTEVDQINLATGVNPQAGNAVTGMRGVRAYHRVTGAHEALSVHGEHSDLGRDAYGTPVYVQVTFHGDGDGVTDGCIFWREVADRTKVYELPYNTYQGSTGTGIHISGCATDRPGLFVIGKYVGVGSGPYDGAVTVAEVVPGVPKASLRVYRLAHTQVSTYTYFAEPHPTPNRGLTRISFASDYGTAADFEDYEIVLPSTAFRVPGLVTVARTASPTVSGTATPGGTLTRTLGTYSGFPAPTVTGIWQTSTNGTTWTDATGFTGATSPTLGANGTYIRWGNEVAAQAGGATTSAVNSNAVQIAALSAPVNTVAPSVPGTSADDVVTTATPGTWTGNPIPTISRMWQQNTGSWVDSAFTTMSASLTAGTWRIGEQGSNTQGTSAWVYSGSCVVAAVPQHIETVGPIAGATVTDVATTVSANVGDTITVSIVQIFGANPPRSLTSVYDTVDGSGAPYSVAKSQVKASGNIRVDVYDRVVTTAGTRTVRSTLSAAGTQSVAVTVRRGVTGRSGTASGADGTSTSPAPGSVTPTGSAVYHTVSATTAGYTTIVKDAAYTSRAKFENGAPPVMEVSDKFGSGASNPATTIGTSAEWVAVQVCYA